MENDLWKNLSFNSHPQVNTCNNEKQYIHEIRIETKMKICISREKLIVIFMSSIPIMKNLLDVTYISGSQIIDFGLLIIDESWQ